MTLNPTSMIGRLKPLSRRHRLAHLCALIRLQPAGSIRGQELAALLRGEMNAPPSCEEHPV